MLEFEESFFQGETIDGFYVESDMKRAWAAQMEVLMEINRICKKYNIQYFAYTGTLLGAVRHKGYIPWDDDLDIAMKREEYERFIKVAPKEIDSSWILRDPRLTKNSMQSFGRLINGDKVNISTEFLQRFHGCPYVVGVDIFPLDYLPPEKAEMEVLWNLYHGILYVKDLQKKRLLIKQNNIAEKTEEENNKLLEEWLIGIEEVLRFKVDRKGSIINQLLLKLNELSKLYREEECYELGNLAFMTECNGKGIPKECYQEAVPLQFESIMIPAPIGYDEVLKAQYGDYMTPVYRSDFHEYPFYKEQRKQVENMLDKLTEINRKLTLLESNV